MSKKQKIIIGVTGASGSIYAKQLIEKIYVIKNQLAEVNIVFTDNAKLVWNYEIGKEAFTKIPYKIYNINDFFAPFASGSAKFDCMIVCPCSMGTLGKIANCISDNLIVRAADVMLKERRKLILVTRDSPLNLIHINNMKIITEAGGIICPASPSFYSKPQNIEQLINSVVERIIDLVGLENEHYRWGNDIEN
ncbi:MAG: UbiX family flavin prenyltransferase [Bacteroidetes bacterium]|jgi:flavin prenyltransferase|nr:UbiX family flavin prenyltransferase [Bacteroidota bacterium]MBT6685993.1 UbiX family flavin prenyltransferase [Bacteroidota bacterium]MBT7143775.1 UbiX family flavin prenyltransferase [Bacteroidota bacterium]MBT7490874.1 UbiX family flavin prenyltransferase [Bacteroidota bacterium]